MPNDPFSGAREAAANAFAAQMTALTALAEALVEEGAIERSALIGNLERRLARYRAEGADEHLVVPLVALIHSLRTQS